jgi:hypothetical protein
LPTSCAVVMKSGNLNFLEPSGPLQAGNGNALPLFNLLDSDKVVGEECSTCGEDGKFIWGLEGRAECKRTLGRPRRRCQCNFNFNILYVNII